MCCGYKPITFMAVLGVGAFAVITGALWKTGGFSCCGFGESDAVAGAAETGGSSRIGPADMSVSVEAGSDAETGEIVPAPIVEAPLDAEGSVEDIEVESSGDPVDPQVERSSGGLFEGIGTAGDREMIVELAAWEVQDAGGNPVWTRKEDVAYRDVESGERTVPQNAKQNLNEEIKSAVAKYINDELIGSDDAAEIVGLDDYLRERRGEILVEGERGIGHKVREYSSGDQHVYYTKLQFDDAFRREIRDRYDDSISFSRLMQVGLVGGGVLAALGLVCAAFRLDNATRGFYTGRLQLFTAAGILMIVALGVCVAVFIPWR